MRVVKSLQQGILTAPFTFQQRHHLGVATLIAFKLGASEQLLTEQQMWQQLLPLLDDSLILDLALPKEQGEWLLMGAACSLKARSYIRVAAAVAGVSKCLEIYGPRVWLDEGRASEPLPIQRQPLRWQQAFGGPQVADNPQGMGAQQPAAIFYPQQTQIFRDQAVAPAGFLPLWFDHPTRACYQGSYDDQWQRDHWPGYPYDLDWRYFNVAPLDQRINGFFQACDPYYLINLHPDLSKIEGKLPSHRPRAFVEYHQGPLVELSLRCDTVWLFSEQQLGIMIYHGVAPIEDDEALDIKQILLGLETADSIPLTAEAYLAQSQQDPIDAAVNPPFAEKAAAQLANAEKTIQDIPKLLQFKHQQISGQMPTPRASLPEQQAIVQQQLDNHRQRLLEMKDWLTTQPVCAEIIQSVEQGEAQLAKMQKQLAALPQQITELSQEVQLAGQQLQQTLPAQPEIDWQPAEKLLNQLANLTDLEKNWSAQASRLISLGQHGLDKPHCQTELQRLGIRLLTQQRYLLGYLSEAQPFIAADWGLDESAERLLIGPGWLFPEFQGEQFVGITVRPGSLLETSDDYRLQGSQPGFWRSGQHVGWAMVIVSEWVNACRLAQDIDHLADVWAIPSPTDLADEVTAILQQAPLLLVPLTAEESIDEWQQQFPQARPLWMGDYTDLTTRLAADEEDQCQWLLTALPAALIPPPATEPDPQAFMQATLGRISKKVGMSDPLAVEAQFMQQLQQFQQQSESFPESVQAMIQPALKNFTLPVREQNPLKQLAQAKQQIDQVFDETTQLLQRYPELNDKAPQLSQFQQQIASLLQQAESLLREGMTQLPCAGEIAEHAEYRCLTREQMVAAYQAGESLVRINLSGIDLSGLSLAGVDLSESILNNSNLSQCDLRNAQLVGVIANKARFTGACLQHANCHQALLSEADLSQINGIGCQLTEALLKGAKLTEANLTRAQLNGVMAEKAQAQRICLQQADLTEAIWLGADLTAADLTDAQVTRVVMNEAILTDSCWRGVDGQAANLWGVSAQQADFTGAKLPNARFGPACLIEAQLVEAELPQSNFLKATVTAANFSGCDLRETYMDRSECTQVNFSEADLRSAQLLRCNFTEAKFYGANAMQASLSKSRLVAADCREANLFNTNLRKVVIGKTQFSKANLRRTLLKHYQEPIDDPR